MSRLTRGSLELPGPPINPKERTHMPLSAAAHWIASEGGANSITADEKWWRPAFEKLIANIASRKLEVSGRCGGLPEVVPSDVFVGIPVAYPCSPNSLQLWTGDGPYLECMLFIDEADWEEPAATNCSDGAHRPRNGHTCRCRRLPSSAVAVQTSRTAHDERVGTSVLRTLLREQPRLTIENARQHLEGYGFGRVAMSHCMEKSTQNGWIDGKGITGSPAKIKTIEWLCFAHRHDFAFNAVGPAQKILTPKSQRQKMSGRSFSSR